MSQIGKKFLLTGVAEWTNVSCVFAHNNMKAFCDMLINSWAILGFNELVVCFRHNIHDGGCNYMFNNVFHGV